MTIQVRTFNCIGDEECLPLDDFIRPLYCQAFPREERRPWLELAALIRKDPCFTLYLIENPDRIPIGFFTTRSLAPELPLAYGEHFAISPQVRGNGIGAAVLKELQKKIPRMIFEVEPPEVSLLAARRIAFYQRNGYTLLPHDYRQPPYRTGDAELPLRLMITTGSEDILDIPKAIAAIHKTVYGKPVEVNE